MPSVGGPPDERPRSGGTRGTRRDTNDPSRRRWDPRLVEAHKVVVAEIPKRERPPTVLRVSVFRQGGHDYADVRIYRLGRGGAYPTRVGLPIHRDLVPDVLAGLSQAADALAAGWPG